MSININESEELEYGDFINVEEVEKLLGCTLPEVLQIVFSATIYGYTPARINCSNDDACPEEGGYLDDASFMFEKVPANKAKGIKAELADLTDFIHPKAKVIIEDRWYDHYT